jgi:hypothetical protein
MDAVPGGGAVMAWQDGRNDGGDIYAQRMSADVATPTTLSLVSATAVDGSVHLVWYGRDAAGVTVTRSVDGSGWTTLGSPQISGEGTLHYDDGNVVAGERYGYRLVDIASGPIAASEAWVTIPAGVPLALGEPRPNPVVGGQISFRAGFETAQPARLDWTDLGGRHVASDPIGDTSPGWREATVTVPSLPPGVYWLVLHQGNHVAHRRVVLLR